MEKRVLEAEGARGAAESARDETLKAKDEAEFAKAEVKASKGKAAQEAYDARVTETEDNLKA